MGEISNQLSWPCKYSSTIASKITMSEKRTPVPSSIRANLPIVSPKKEGASDNTPLEKITKIISITSTQGRSANVDIVFFHKQLVRVKPVKWIGVMKLSDRSDARQRERLPGTRWVVYSGVTLHLWQNQGITANVIELLIKKRGVLRSPWRGSYRCYMAPVGALRETPQEQLIFRACW